MFALKQPQGQDPAEVYKIANLTDMVAEPNPLENIDTDGDGVNDALDYWYNDNLEVITKEELDCTPTKFVKYFCCCMGYNQVRNNT